MDRRMGRVELAVLADDIADMAESFIVSRDYRSLRNMANNLARMIRIHVPTKEVLNQLNLPDGDPNG